MAWSYRTRRSYSRTVRRSFRRRRLPRARYRRRRVHRRPYRRGTRSAVVTLTQDAEWTLGTGAASSRTWNPFTFTPANLPGFLDYRATYSHFRILKAKLFISRAVGSLSGTTNNYLVVGSRPFSATQSPTTSAGTNEQLVPPQYENALRQTRWQRVHYPNTTTNVVSAGFYPYTLIQTNGPNTSSGASVYLWQRIWEGKRWMPFTWATASSTALSFFGPYLVVDTSTGELTGNGPFAVQCTLRVSVQFKGQK